MAVVGFWFTLTGIALLNCIMQQVIRRRREARAAALAAALADEERRRIIRENEARARRAREEQQRRDREKEQRAAARAARQAETARKKAEKLAYAREMADLKERTLTAEKALRALKKAPAEQISFLDPAPDAETENAEKPVTPAAPRPCSLQASREVETGSYEVYGSARRALDLDTFEPSAAFLLHAFPVLAYQIGKQLVPAGDMITLHGRYADGTETVYRYQVPASALYEAHARQ